VLKMVDEWNERMERVILQVNAFAEEARIVRNVGSVSKSVYLWADKVPFGG
jgi:hypothetical protein